MVNGEIIYINKTITIKLNTLLVTLLDMFFIKYKACFLSKKISSIAIKEQ
jgi:hypothetical protein